MDKIEIKEIDIHKNMENNEIDNFLEFDNNLDEVVKECDENVVEHGTLKCFICKRFFETIDERIDNLGFSCSSEAYYDNIKSVWKILCMYGSKLDNDVYIFHKPKYFNDTRKKYTICDGCIIRLYKENIIYLYRSDFFIGFHEYNNPIKNGRFDGLFYFYTYKDDVLTKVEKNKSIKISYEKYKELVEKFKREDEKLPPAIKIK